MYTFVSLVVFVLRSTRSNMFVTRKSNYFRQNTPVTFENGSTRGYASKKGFRDAFLRKLVQSGIPEKNYYNNVATVCRNNFELPLVVLRRKAHPIYSPIVFVRVFVDRCFTMSFIAFKMPRLRGIYLGDTNRCCRTSPTTLRHLVKQRNGSKLFRAYNGSTYRRFYVSYENEKRQRTELSVDGQ